MTDQELIARLLDAETDLADCAVDCIEELVKERDEALTKLDKVVEMLQFVVDLVQHGRFVLRELEGK